MHDTRTSRSSRSNRMFLGLALGLAIVAAGCGGADAGDAASTAPDATTRQAAPTSSGVVAAKAAGTVETQHFSTVLPEGWEVLADDMESMGLMTLARKGSGGQQAVYVKFEGGGYKGDPMKAIETFSQSYDGTPARSVSRSGVDWAHTRYSYNGLEQSLNMTAQNGYKVTFTVMGDDYDASPGVKAIFDNLSFR